MNYEGYDTVNFRIEGIYRSNRLSLRGFVMLERFLRITARLQESYFRGEMIFTARQRSGNESKVTTLLLKELFGSL